MEVQKTAQGLVVEIQGVSNRKEVSKARGEMLKVLGQGIHIDVFQLSEVDLSLWFGVGGRKGQLH